jgi:hypothetical protein
MNYNLILNDELCLVFPNSNCKLIIPPSSAGSYDLFHNSNVFKPFVNQFTL